MKPEYVNTDLELRSKSDMASLVDELSRKLCMLYNGREGRNYLATFEITGLTHKPSDTSDRTANRFCTVIESLSRKHRLIWNKCISRHLDMGFHSGEGNKLGTATLQAETITRLAKLKIAVAVSVYPLQSKHRNTRRTTSSFVVQLRNEIAMNQLLRFPSSIKRDPAIEVWMQRRPGELGAIAQRWFEVIRHCGDDVRELLHDGHPTACIGDAAFAYVNAFKAHVNVGFFRGAEIADPEGLLDGTGKFMRHVKLRPGCDLDATALTKLIETAYADMKMRLKAK